MTKEQLAIAKEALYRYELARIKHIESLPQVDFQPSAEYTGKMEEIRTQIGKNTLKSKTVSNKHKVCIFIAATLILASIATACAFGNQIKGFFVDWFDSFSSVQPSEDRGLDYKEYKLTWIPEDYRETNVISVGNTIKTIYSNNKNSMYFICYPVSHFYAVIDTQRSEFEVINLNDIEIYYSVKNNSYAIYWVNDDATLYIYCNTGIEWSDIEKMILSVKSAE